MRSKKDKIVGIYTHAKPNGVIFYVGKGTEVRAKNLKRLHSKHSSIVKKYGKENIIVTFIPCENENIAFELEKQLIKVYRESYGSLVNITDGGEGWANFAPWKNKKLSKEHREAISKGGQGIKRSMITKKAISAGKKNAQFSVEHREKLSQAHKARVRKPHSLETKRKIGLAQKNKALSEETKDKIRKSLAETLSSSRATSLKRAVTTNYGEKTNDQGYSAQDQGRYWIVRRHADGSHSLCQ